LTETVAALMQEELGHAVVTEPFLKLAAQYQRLP